MRIQRRLVVALVLLLCGLALPLRLLVDHDLGRAARAELLLALEREASLLGAELERAPPVDANAWARGHEARTGTQLMLYDTTGRLTADSSPLGADPDRLVTDQGLPEVAEARRGRRARGSTASDPALYFVAVPLGAEAPHAVLRVARPPDGVERPLRAGARSVWLALCASFGAALLLVLLLIRWLARPVRAMTRVARAMSRGRFDESLPVPTEDELGDLVRALALLRTQLAARLEELRSEGEKLRTILDGMVEGVALVQRGRISVANRRFRLLLGTVEEVEGRAPLDVARLPELAEALAEARAGADTALREVQVGRRALGLQAHPLGEPSEEQAVVVVSDLSESRRLERLRRDLVANASHELRTPVAAILGVAETLAAGAADDVEARASFIDILVRHAQRLSRLTSDLLDLSRLESGYRPRTETVRLADVAEGVLATLGPRADAKSLTLSTHLPTELTASADRAAVEQILTNLVDNAVKYTPHGGSVQLRGERLSDGRVELVVEDTGPGIPVEHQPRLFERFYRVDDARSRELGGTGLGLAIVKHLALALGGEVGVESRLGRGSRFWVRLLPPTEG